MLLVCFQTTGTADLSKSFPTPLSNYQGYYIPIVFSSHQSFPTHQFPWIQTISLQLSTYYKDVYISPK